MSNLYLYISLFLFAFLSFVWSKSGWTNALIKFSFFGMFVYGLVLALQTFGFIVKV